MIEGVPAEQTEFDLPGAAATSKTGLKAAMHMYDELRKKILPDLRIGLLHGRLSTEEKDETMRRFKNGEVDVLVSTTVIEVGVDVPNASVMVVEHAERFGLAQLHQLRGRIGRGAAKSYCVLMTGGKVSLEAERRLNEMVRTQDGFEIAELDLDAGAGQNRGEKNSGTDGPGDYRAGPRTNHAARKNPLAEKVWAGGSRVTSCPEAQQRTPMTSLHQKW